MSAFTKTLQYLKMNQRKEQDLCGILALRAGGRQEGRKQRSLCDQNKRTEWTEQIISESDISSSKEKDARR